MAYVMATELATKQRVWVCHNHKLDKKQLNSHREGPLGNSLKDAGVDGLDSADLAGLVTDYSGPIYLEDLLK